MAATEETKTVCTYCGVGCSFDVETRGREILRVQPQIEGPANSISTCVKGKFGWDHINAQDRLTKPLVRDGDRFRGDLLGRGPRPDRGRAPHAIVAESGPDAIGVIGSSKATNEESYLTQKLARQVIGTHNTDNCSRYCQAPATQGLWRTVGYGGDAGSISDMERASLVLMVGTNTADSHPVIASRLRRAQKLNGQVHVVVDLRRHEMAQRADVFLKPAPGTDLVWLSAVTGYILDEGLADEAFLKERVNGLEDYRASLAPYTIEHAEERVRHPGRDPARRRPPDRRRRVGRRAVGDGRHPALDGLRHLHGHLQPAAGHRQLRPPRHRRLPPARAQQRAGLQRLRHHQHLLPRLPAGRRRGDAGQVREGLGPRALRWSPAWTTTRWSTRSRTARCGR